MSEGQIPVGSHRAPTVLCAYPSTTHRLRHNTTRMRFSVVSETWYLLKVSLHSSITSLTSGSISAGPTRRVTHDTMKNTRNEETIATADAVTPAGNVKIFQ